jgi:hypothetical protein
VEYTVENVTRTIETGYKWSFETAWKGVTAASGAVADGADGTVNYVGAEGSATVHVHGHGFDSEVCCAHNSVCHNSPLLRLCNTCHLCMTTASMASVGKQIQSIV